MAKNKIGDILIQRVILGYGESLSGDPLFSLTNLQSTQFQFSSDSNDFTTGDGSTLKTVYRNRQCQVTATNALINFPIISQMGGREITKGTSAAPISAMPRIITINTNEVTLPDLKDATKQNVRISAIGQNGNLGDKYELSVGEATEGTYSLGEGGKLTITAKEGDTKWLIYYERDSENGIEIRISGNKFPSNIRMVFRALAYDVCQTDVARSVYIVMNNFQPSPDLDLNIQNDGSTLDFVGKANVDYCSQDKDMLIVYYDPDDEDGDTI